MLELLTPPLAEVRPGVSSLIQDKWLVKFSDGWPATISQVVATKPKGGIYGRFFQVIATNQVPHDLPYIIPANDFRDVDFSNNNTGFTENLYPMQAQTLYEIQLGFKPGNFTAHFYIPAGQNLSRLEQTSMVAPDPPTINALNFASPLRYLGAKKYWDSPYHDKRIYIYTMMNMDALIMRLFVDSGLPVIATDYEKIVVGLVINKCRLAEIPVTSFDDKGNILTLGDWNPAQTKDKLQLAKLIEYCSDQRW